MNILRLLKRVMDLPESELRAHLRVREDARVFAELTEDYGEIKDITIDDRGDIQLMNYRYRRPRRQKTLAPDEYYTEDGRVVTTDDPDVAYVWKDDHFGGFFHKVIR